MCAPTTKKALMVLMDSNSVLFLPDLQVGRLKERERLRQPANFLAEVRRSEPETLGAQKLVASLLMLFPIIFLLLVATINIIFTSRFSDVMPCHGIFGPNIASPKCLHYHIQCSNTPNQNKKNGTLG